MALLLPMIGMFVLVITFLLFVAVMHAILSTDLNAFVADEKGRDGFGFDDPPEARP